MTELNVEALAQQLAWEDYDEYLSGEFCVYPAPEDDEEIQEMYAIGLPYAREKAEKYAAILAGTREPQSGSEL